MSPQRSKLESVDRPEPDEALSGIAARTRDHEPRDEDDREVVLDDPTLPEIAIEEDRREPGGASA